VIGRLFATLAGSAWARTTLRYGVTALAILLFLLALRRSGERAGRVAERLETAERSHDAQRRMREAVARRPHSRDDLAVRLCGCATGASDVASPDACPPVAEHSRESQARAGEELARLPEGSAVEEMLNDCAVMREPVRVRSKRRKFKGSDVRRCSMPRACRECG